MRQYIGSPSHYCRSTSKRKYLDSKLTVTKIYEQFRTFFQEKVPSDNTDRKVSSEDVYRHIFVLNLIWVFMSPKKDQWALCSQKRQRDGDPPKDGRTAGAPGGVSNGVVQFTGSPGTMTCHSRTGTGSHRQFPSLLLLGIISCSINATESTLSKKQKSVARKKTRVQHFYYNHQRICQDTFMYLMDVSKEKPHNLKQWYLHHGLVPIIIIIINIFVKRHRQSYRGAVRRCLVAGRRQHWN